MTGGYFLDALDAEISSLSRLGGIHRKVHGHHQLLTRKFPYAVYYEIDGGIVLVNAVVDCRRNPEWIKRRLALG